MRRRAPRTEVASLFDLAERKFSALGIRVYLTTLAEAAEIQAANQDSWEVFPPMLDTRLSVIRENESYAIVGVGRDEIAVFNHAGRVYEGTQSLAEKVADRSFCYGAAIPPDPEMPYAEVTAPIAHVVRGKFAYIGASWVHPEYRRQQIAVLISLVSRACAYSLWAPDWVVGMFPVGIKPEALASYGYRHNERSLWFHNMGPKPVERVLTVIDSKQLLLGLERFVEEQT